MADGKIAIAVERGVEGVELGGGDSEVSVNEVAIIAAHDGIVFGAGS